MLKKNLVLILFLSVNFQLFSEQKKYRIHTLAFYNVENLFDTINDVNKNDEASPIMEMNYNRSKVYNKKLLNTSKVISGIGLDETKNLPTIVGLCEVENRKVIEDLISTEALKSGNYGISHFDSPDERGIDVALIFRKSFFKVIDEKSMYLNIYDKTRNRQDYTRDQLVVKGELEGDIIYIIVNHWPSRSGGESRSRPLRNKAAELNKFIIDSIQNIDRKAKIITMGDFNDDPTNESIKKILNANNSKDDTKINELYNPMEDMHKKGMGTLAYRDNWNLFDQILLTGSLINSSYKSFSYYQSKIYDRKFLFNQSGRFKGYPFRSFAGGSFLDGYSDHLPVYILLIREL